MSNIKPELSERVQELRKAMKQLTNDFPEFTFVGFSYDDKGIETYILHNNGIPDFNILLESLAKLNKLVIEQVLIHAPEIIDPVFDEIKQKSLLESLDASKMPQA